MPSRREFLRWSCAGTSSLLLPRLGAALYAQEAASGWPAVKHLQGNYAPLREEREPAELKVQGELPAELRGTFVRNGSNPRFAPLDRYHWFDGDGMLHAVELGDGKALYRNRWVRTTAFQAESKEGRALWGGMLDSPMEWMGKVPQGLPRFKNPANTAVLWHHGKLLALYEGGGPFEVSLPDLETVGPYDFGGALEHRFTAHPKVDPVSGRLYFFGYWPMPPYLYYSCADPDGSLRFTRTLPLGRAAILHDFAISGRHAVFFDNPVTVSMQRVMQGQPPVAFEPEKGARLLVVDRDDPDAEAQSFEIEPGFVYHTLNAWDEEDCVVVYACRAARYPGNMGLFDAEPNASADARPDQPTLCRWRVDLATGAVEEDLVDGAVAEFPRLAEDHLGQLTRFGYCVRGGLGDLLKYDLEGGACEVHAHGKGKVSDEAIFVPAPHGRREDDGWLLTFVYDQAQRRSELVVVRADDFAAAPVARVTLPGRVPFGFHGTWVPA